MLGSLGEAEDAVQEAWLRLERSESGDIANLGGWLTTVVGRVCLDMLCTRKSRREDSLDDDAAPGPPVDAQGGGAALVDGRVGVVVAPMGRLFLVLQVTVSQGKIVAIDAIADSARLIRIELGAFTG
jgi:hypothetical protein